MGKYSLKKRNVFQEHFLAHSMKERMGSKRDSIFQILGVKLLLKIGKPGKEPRLVIIFREVRDVLPDTI